MLSIILILHSLFMLLIIKSFSLFSDFKSEQSVKKNTSAESITGKALKTWTIFS